MPENENSPWFRVYRSSLVGMAAFSIQRLISGQIADIVSLAIATLSLLMISILVLRSVLLEQERRVKWVLIAAMALAHIDWALTFLGIDTRLPFYASLLGLALFVTLTLVRGVEPERRD